MRKEDGNKCSMLGTGTLTLNSVNGDFFYVSSSRISFSEGSEDGRRVQFCKCSRTKVKRIVFSLASLALLDIALSVALVRIFFSCV